MKQNNTRNRALKIIGTVLAMPIILILITIALLYVPSVQRYAISKISGMVAQNSGYNLDIGTFRLQFPLYISISDYTLHSESDTLLNGDRLRININPWPLLKGEVEVNYISIDNTVVDSHDALDGIRVAGDIGYFRTSIRNAKPGDSIVNINRLNLTDSRVALTLGESTQPKDTTSSTPAAWFISLNNGKMENVSFEMSIPNDTTNISAHIGKTQLRGADIDLGNGAYSLKSFTLSGSSAKYDTGTTSDSISPAEHLHFDNISLQMKEIYYSEESINARLEKISLQQQPVGITIENGGFDIIGDTTAVSINNLLIASRNGTVLNADATIPWQLIKGTNGNDKADGEIELHLDKRDLQGFIPHESYATLHTLPDSMLNLDAAFHGNMRTMRLDTIHAEITGVGHINLNGEGSNLADAKKRAFDLRLSGSVRDLRRVLYGTAQPDSTAQQRLSIDGTASLHHGEYNADVKIASGSGKADVKGSYIADGEIYDTKVTFSNFDIAALLPQIPLRKLSMAAELKGEGTDIFSDSTRYICNLSVDSMLYDSLMFNDITLEATQARSLSNIHIVSDEEPLRMELWADTRFNKNNIENRTKIDAKRIEMKSLGLSQHPINSSMKLDIDAVTNLDDTYTLRAVGEELLFTLNGKNYAPGRLELEASTNSDSTQLDLKNGDLKINGFITAGYRKFLESINRVALLVERNIEARDTISDIRRYERLLPETSLNISGKRKNILADYLSINGITYEELFLNCRLDSLKGLNARGSIYNLEHGKQHLDTVRILLRQDSSNLRYFTGIRSTAIEGNDDKATFGAALFGALDRNELTANYLFRDKNDSVGMRIGVAATMESKGLRLRFSPKATLFRQPFTFNDDNHIFIDRDMNLSGNIEMRDNGNSGLNLYATSDSTENSDIALELFNINLQAVTKLLPFAPDISGTVNADLHYRDDNGSMLFSGDVRSEALTYEGTLIGDETLEFSYFPKGKNEHFTNITLLHNDEQVARLDGVYSNDSLNRRNSGELLLTHFPLSVANAFIKESGVTASGYIDGEMSIGKEKEMPIANGYLKFDSAYADLPRFGTNLHLVDDRVEIKENLLTFKDFDIYAKGNTPFKVNGTIDLGTLPDPTFNLRMRADNYELINARRAKNSILYGRMFINMNSRITGTLNTLNINGSTTILGKSDITYVLQDTPLEAENTLDGLVTFTNFQDTTQVEQPEQEYDLGNINMNITLSIEEGARINADFDLERTSYIELQGEGNLNLTYTGEAGMNLTGRYLLSNGQMKYTLPVIPLKTFNIIEGSYINWTGDIFDPMLNITALERVRTSVTIDESSQAVEFDVGVKLSNTLSDMGLSFIMSAPENAVVQNQLNMLDSETLNKYALTMLITGAYLGGNSNSLTVSSALSSFLDSQINNLVGNAMNSTMDINVGITDLEDHTTGDTYKNYSFSFTKRFWNDRLKVIIGGEVNNNANANADESFINNVSLEWKISTSGNRYLRLFYDKNYESILEGEITEAGVGYVYKRKLNNLNELLIFRKKKSVPQTEEHRE